MQYTLLLLRLLLPSSSPTKKGNWENAAELLGLPSGGKLSVKCVVFSSSSSQLATRQETKRQFEDIDIADGNDTIDAALLFTDGCFIK